MTPQNKQQVAWVEAAINEILFPLGFKRHKLIWRRVNGETLQQFSIVSMQLDSRYRPEWGLNLLNRCEDPKPLPWKLQVRWIFEMSVCDLKERLRYFDSLNFDKVMSGQRRAQLLSQLIYGYVIPAFEQVTSEDSVRQMMGNYKCLYRAQSYVGLPDEWWPKEVGGPGGADRAAMRKPVLKRFDSKRGLGND